MSKQSPELSYIVSLEELPKGGRKFEISANADQCVAIAKRFSVIAVETLNGEITIRAAKSRIEVRGAVKATLRRECVASLEEFVETIEEPFEISYIRTAAAISDEEDVTLDTPDIHEGPDFDIGELLVQQASLAMSPFPRKPGAASLAKEFGSESEMSAFAQALASATKREENQ